MPKPITAASLRASIDTLETKLPGLVAAIKDAENTVADCFAAGDSPEKALDLLARAKDAHAGALRALMELDRRWYETAQAERAAATKEIEDRSEREFLRLEREIKVVFKKSIAPLIETAGLPATKSDEFAEAVAASAWEAISSRASEEQFALGPAPKEPGPRDEVDGHVLTAEERNRRWTGPSGFYNAPPPYLGSTPLSPERVERAIEAARGQ